MATHLSVGFADTVGTGVEESPSSPSVNADEHTLGTKDPDNCFQADGEVDPDKVTAAVSTHAFCGHLAYNDNTIFEADGPADQIYNDDSFVGSFDVQRTWYVGNFLLGTCFPMCDDGGTQNETWNQFHTVGEAAGLTEGPEEADDDRDDNADGTETERDRYQWYQMQLDVRNAPGIVQSNTGAWEMNGWAHPYALEHFVGFLFDGQGKVVTDERLNEYFRDNSAKFGPESTSKVCGFTPDFDYVSTGEQSFCEVELTYAGEDPNNGTEGDEPFTSYNDRCNTPTYVCGAAGGNYWEGDALGLAAYGGNGAEYTAWHWTVAPNQPDCANTNPGFDLDVSDDTASERFVAHDLDVYTPVTGLSTGPTVSVENPDEYLDSLLPGTEQVEDQAVATAELVFATADDESRFLNSGTAEPNHVSGTPIDDESRAEINEGRELLACEKLDSNEDPSLVDPWVNYVNGGVSDRSVGFYAGVETVGTGSPAVGLYPSNDPAHDDENDPTTDTYTPNGFVGVFTDKNDDGEYEQVVGSDDSTDGFSPAVYQDAEIQSTGAYPMLWDMWVNETAADKGTAKINTGQGCTGPGSQPFALTMAEAGYGPNTGIAQAFFLAEPTVWYDLAATNPQSQPYAGGDNIYVLGNQAVKQLWDGDINDGADQFQLSEDVDTLVEGLQSYVTGNYDVTADDIQIHQPSKAWGLDSDYGGQCGESTGGFFGSLSFSHSCETDCSGDTIATMYSYEVADSATTIGGGEIPALSINNDGVDYTFPSDTETSRWFDIDAFDGDTSRNTQPAGPPT